jgi:iron uptake system component EfeO
MTGDGITVPLTVTAASGTAAAPPVSRDPRLARAVDEYRTYVEQQTASSLTGAEALAAAIEAGDTAKAKALYAPSRVGWERIEPVAESFGDLDPRIDLREADLEDGDTWTGWHVLEKTLWTRNTTAGLEPVAAQLVKDLEELAARVPKAEISASSMANGAKELLDEVSATKVTGEEEAFSHTDLADVQANVTGARTVVGLLEPVLAERDAELRGTLESRFDALEALVATHRTGKGDTDFASYEKVTQAQRRELSDAVDAVAEPLSRLTAAVVS